MSALRPTLVFEKPARCSGACASFEKQSLEHPAVQRRLAEVVFVTRPAKEPALALFDRSGKLVTRIAGLPRDVTVFANLLDSIVSIKPNLERAVMLNETAGPHEGDLELAAALIILGRA